MRESEPIRLGTQIPFAEGHYRACYVHPEDADLVIKVLRGAHSPTRVRQLAPWYKRLRPLHAFDDNAREHRAYRAMGHTDEPEHALWGFIPQFVGTVATDLGLGRVTRLIRDDDGAIASDLRAYLRRPEWRDACHAAVTRLRTQLLAHAVLSRNLLPHNIVAQKCGQDLRLWLVDGLGCADAVPLAQVSPAFARIRMEHKIRKFFRKYMETSL